MSRSRESSLGSVAMEEEEDDLYGTAPTATQPEAAATAEDLEDGEEEESEEDESDIEIVTERPDLGPDPTARSGAKSQDASQPVANGTASATASTTQPSSNARQATATIRISADTSSHPVAQPKPVMLPGAKYPALRTSSSHLLSQFDADNIPLWEGKPITELDIDADLAEAMKPWRRPGADQADYFNYGFDEFTWAMYCERVKVMKGGIEEQRNESKMFEQMMGGMGMPSMGGMGGMGGQGGGNSPMPGAQQGGGPNEQDMQQAMWQAMQQQGVSDPSQLNFEAFMQSFQGQMGGQGGGVPTGPSGGGGQGGWGGQQGGYGGGGGGGGRRGRGRW